MQPGRCAQRSRQARRGGRELPQGTLDQTRFRRGALQPGDCAPATRQARRGGRELPQGALDQTGFRRGALQPGACAPEQGKLDAAVESYHKALSIKPDFAEAHNNLGNALKEQGKLDEAIASYHKALSFKPDFAEAHNNLGVALKEQGKLDEAVASYRQALLVQAGLCRGAQQPGDCAQRQGKLDEAVASYRKALSFKPDYAEAHNNLGIALQEQGKLDEAVASFRQALSFKPDYAEAHNNLGNALKEQGKLDEAIASYRQALSIKPDYAEAHSNLGTKTWNKQDPRRDQTRQDTPYHPNTTRKTTKNCGPGQKNLLRLFRAAWQPHCNGRERGRRLKVGYVSPDFRRHVVAYFAEPILANHDRKQVEIYCYAEVKREDDYTRRFRRMADHWHSTVGLSDGAMALLSIREHQIDILVDLADTAPTTGCWYLAPQACPDSGDLLGYPATTGLTAMDYRITDRHADPEGIAEARYVERLVRLPDSLWCYRPAADMPEVTSLPALTRGYPTYGSFNNFNKIDRLNS